MSSAIPRLLRACEQKINNEIDGKYFVRCTCCERTKVGVPCPCLFRVAREANIPFHKIMDVGMLDGCYLKLFDTKYDCKEEVIANILYDAQAVSD